MEENTEQRVDLTLFSEKIQELKDRIASVIVGQEQTVDLVLTAILANGHVLIEGVPGVAKTLLARLTARLIDADFSRIQFTPDLMPSDVLGTTVFNMKTNSFDFHQGPIFADIVLVDEINRAPAKTQAALFEVMEERQISIDGTTHRMGELFTIMATQNPVEQEGTYKLPEAQLDRFLMKITMDYPSLEEEVNILERHQTNAALVKLDNITPSITKEELLSLRAFMNRVFVVRSNKLNIFRRHKIPSLQESIGFRGLQHSYGCTWRSSQIHSLAGTRLLHNQCDVLKQRTVYKHPIHESTK